MNDNKICIENLQKEFQKEQGKRAENGLIYFDLIKEYQIFEKKMRELRPEIIKESDSYHFLGQPLVRYVKNKPRIKSDLNFFSYYVINNMGMERLVDQAYEILETKDHNLGLMIRIVEQKPNFLRWYNEKD